MHIGILQFQHQLLKILLWNKSKIKILKMTLNLWELCHKVKLLKDLVKKKIIINFHLNLKKLKLVYKLG